MYPRTILGTCLISVVLLHTNAVLSQRIFDLGPKAGFSVNDLSSGMAHSSIIGWQGGLFARVKPPLFPGVQGEVLLASIGSDLQIAGATDARVRSMVLQMPVFLVFPLGPAELHAGGYFDHLLSTSVDGGVDVEGTVQDAGDFTDGEYGLLAGVGLHLGRIYAGGRYLHGLTDIGTGDGFLGDASNRQLQFYIAFGLFKAD